MPYFLGSYFNLQHRVVTCCLETCMPHTFSSLFLFLVTFTKLLSYEIALRLEAKLCLNAVFKREDNAKAKTTKKSQNYTFIIKEQDFRDPSLRKKTNTSRLL